MLLSFFIYLFGLIQSTSLSNYFFLFKASFLWGNGTNVLYGGAGKPIDSQEAGNAANSVRAGNTSNSVELGNAANSVGGAGNAGNILGGANVGNALKTWSNMIGILRNGRGLSISVGICGGYSAGSSAEMDKGSSTSFGISGCYSAAISTLSSSWSTSIRIEGSRATINLINFCRKYRPIWHRWKQR